MEEKNDDLYRSDSTKVLIDTLSFNTEIPVLDLVEVKKGKNGGSWIHPDLGIQLAQSSSEWMDKNLIFYRKSRNKNKTTKGKKREIEVKDQNVKLLVSNDKSALYVQSIMLFI